MALTRPRSLRYPGGSSPGIDWSHPASANLQFSGVSIPANVLGLFGAIGKGTATGTPSASIDGILGPVTNLNTNSYVSLQGVNNAPAAATISVIVNLTSVASFYALFGHTDLGFNGWNFEVNSGSLQMFSGGGSSNSSGITLTTGTPFFLACSVSSSAANFIAVNLKNGKVQKSFGGAGVALAQNAGGRFLVGANSGLTSQCLLGSISAVVYSGVALSQAQLLQWAQDPWAFWYPNFGTMRPAFFSQPAAGGGSSTLTAAQGSFTETGEAAIFDMKAPAAFGSFTEAGAAAALGPGIVGAFGSFVATGEAATFDMRMPAAFGSFSLTGEPVTFSTTTLMTAAFGSFTEAGEAATFDTAMPAAFGSFTFTGEPAALGPGIVAAFGSFSETGEVATFDVKLTAAFGSFALTGEPATLSASGSATLTASFGSFLFTGEPASLVSSGAALPRDHPFFTTMGRFSARR